MGTGRNFRLDSKSGKVSECLPGDFSGVWPAKGTPVPGWAPVTVLLKNLLLPNATQACPQPCPQQPPAALSKPRGAGNSCCAAVRCVLHKRIPAEGAPEHYKDLYQNIGEALSLDTEIFGVRNVKCHFRFWGEKGEKGAAVSPPVPHPCCQAPSEWCSPSPNPHLGAMSDACGIGDSISSGNLQTWLTLAGATWSGKVSGASFPFLIAFFFPYPLCLKSLSTAIYLPRKTTEAQICCT